MSHISVQKSFYLQDITLSTIIFSRSLYGYKYLDICKKRHNMYLRRQSINYSLLSFKDVSPKPLVYLVIIIDSNSHQ